MSLEAKIRELAIATGTDVKAIRTWINGNAADLSGLTTTAKGNLVAAINEVKAASAAAAGINDSVTGTTTTWSSTKTSGTIDSRINTAVAALVNGAPTALDTLKELADALSANTSADNAAVAALTTALDNRVRYDAAQTLTSPQQAQARTNIGAASAAAVGDTEAAFLTDYNTAKA